MALDSLGGMEHPDSLQVMRFAGLLHPFVGVVEDFAVATKRPIGLNEASVQVAFVDRVGSPE